MAEDVFAPHVNTLYSIIGEGTFLRGDFNVKGLLRIDGDFKGNIQSDGKILISKNGRAEGFISAEVVIIGGVFKGDILAHQQVEILSTAVFVGRIESPRLIVHEEVIFHGECCIQPEIKMKNNSKIFGDKKNSSLLFEAINLGIAEDKNCLPEKVAHC